MKQKKEANRPKRECKSFVGFWTWQDSKDKLEKLAFDARMSVSAYVNELVERHLAMKGRRG